MVVEELTGSALNDYAGIHKLVAESEIALIDYRKSIFPLLLARKLYLVQEELDKGNTDRNKVISNVNAGYRKVKLVDIINAEESAFFDKADLVALRKKQVVDECIRETYRNFNLALLNIKGYREKNPIVSKHVTDELNALEKTSLSGKKELDNYF